MAKTIFKKWGIGFQIQRMHYRDEKNNIGFSSAYAPVTIGLKSGKFMFSIRKSRGIK